MHTFGPKQLLSLISSAFPGLVTYVDSEYRYHFANLQYQLWLGVDPKDVIGKQVWEVIGNEGFELRKEYFDRALKGERVKFISKLNHRFLGEREIEQIYDPDFREDGTIRGLVALGLDITDQRRTAKLIQESEAKFRSLTEVMPQLVWIADKEGKVIYTNENWVKTTGLNFDQISGNGWLNALHPEDRIKTILVWNETINASSDFEAEYRLKMVDGSYRWHMARASCVRDENNQLLQWIGTTTDIEEQKNARDLAMLEKKKMFALFMQAPVAICLMSGPDHQFELINEPAKTLFGRDRKYEGSHLKEVLPELEEQNLFHIMDEIYHTGKGQLIAAQPVVLNEVEYFLDLFFEPIKDENGLTSGVLSMIVDVSNQVRALKIAEEKEKNLEEALVTRDQFLSIASHELKTPLTSLKLQAQLNLRSLNLNRPYPPEKQIAMARETSDLVGRLTRLIDDMLDVSRIKTGKLKLDKASYDLADIVREAVLRMSVLFEAAGQELPKIRVTEKILGDWDRFRLEQVVGNLLTNAIRYGLGKPIEIDIKKQDNIAILSVKDFGYGIEEQDISRIFGRFERAIKSSEVSGLGLGLFISKEIVESHGGEIWAESEYGNGSVFFVKLPLK